MGRRPTAVYSVLDEEQLLAGAYPLPAEEPATNGWHGEELAEPPRPAGSPELPTIERAHHPHVARALALLAFGAAIVGVLYLTRANPGSSASPVPLAASSPPVAAAARAVDPRPVGVWHIRPRQPRRRIRAREATNANRPPVMAAPPLPSNVPTPPAPSSTGVEFSFER